MSTFNKNICLFGICFLLYTNGFSQISITNGSFEGPAPGANPPNWSTWWGSPDTQPGIACDSLTPYVGQSYLGFGYGGGPPEAIGQQLAQPIVKNKSYKFTVALSKTNSTVQFCGGIDTTANVQLEIWGTNQAFGQSKLLWKSTIVNHSGWVLYSGSFTADSNYTYIRLQSDRSKLALSYILVDALSDFKEVIPRVFFGTNNNGCKSDGLLYTTIAASTVNLHSSFLKSDIPTQKINDTTWKYNINYPLDCTQRKDTLLAKAYFTNDTATSISIINVACLYDTCFLSPIIPNLITSNSDGKNDRFEIKYLPKGSLLSIYNRWGELVFESTSYQNNWPDENISAGIYYYYLHTSDKEYKGWVEVVK